MVLDQREQEGEVVGPGEFDAAAREHRLQQLLDRLLGMKAKDLVGDRPVSPKGSQGRDVARRLAQEEPGEVATVTTRQ